MIRTHFEASQLHQNTKNPEGQVETLISLGQEWGTGTAPSLLILFGNNDCPFPSHPVLPISVGEQEGAANIAQAELSVWRAGILM